MTFAIFIADGVQYPIVRARDNNLALEWQSTEFSRARSSVVVFSGCACRFTTASAGPLTLVSPARLKDD